MFATTTTHAPIHVPLYPSHRRRGRVLAGCCHPRCNADRPDVIAETLSVDARTPTPGAPMVPMAVSSHRTTAFPVRETGRRSPLSPSTASEGRSISELQYSFASFWPPHLLAAQTVPTWGLRLGCRDVHIPPEEPESLPPLAWDMLITRIDPVVMGRLALPPFLSRVGCSSRTKLLSRGFTESRSVASLGRK